MAIKAALAASAPYVTAATAGLQFLGSIQNARYQSNLAEQKAKQIEEQASFEAEESRLQLERERLNLALEERTRRRDAASDIGTQLASAYSRGINPMWLATYGDLADDLNILRTEEQLLTAKTKSLTANILVTGERQTAAVRAEGDALRAAGYAAAGTSLLKGMAALSQFQEGKTFVSQSQREANNLADARRLDRRWK